MPIINMCTCSREHEAHQRQHSSSYLNILLCGLWSQVIIVEFLLRWLKIKILGAEREKGRRRRSWLTGGSVLLCRLYVRSLILSSFLALTSCWSWQRADTGTWLLSGWQLRSPHTYCPGVVRSRFTPEALHCRPTGWAQPFCFTENYLTTFRGLSWRHLSQSWWKMCKIID